MYTQSDPYDDKPKDPSGIPPFTIKEPQKREPSGNGTLQLFRDYCSHAGLNGLVYFSEERTWLEYLWWAVAFVLAACGAIYMIHEIYEKWLQSPVIVSFATKNIPISDIPFPAVTLCPIIKLNSSYFNLTRYEENEYEFEDEATKREMDKVANYMSLICDDYESDAAEDYIDPDDFQDVIYRHTANLKEHSLVEIAGTVVPFSKVFKETFTETGLCYTANRLRLDEVYTDIVVRNERHYDDFNTSSWDASKGYIPGVRPSEAYPRRAMGAGISKGMHIYLSELDGNNDMTCSNLLQGYTLTVHYPARIPRTLEDMLFLPADSGIAIPISASVVMTSERVRDYPPEKRDCFFPSEKHLAFYKVYTLRNCELECLTNTTLKKCGCVQFHMPRENGTKVCGPAKMDCVTGVKTEVVNTVIGSNSDHEYGIVDEEDDREGLYSCDCLPMCTDIAYHGSIEPLGISPNLLDKLKQKTGLADPGMRYQFSVGILYFKRDRAVTTERSELYGPSDFISNFGGLVGLFNGFSLLSLVEIVYYLTLRIWSNIKLFGYWAGPKDKQT